MSSITPCPGNPLHRQAALHLGTLQHNYWDWLFYRGMRALIYSDLQATDGHERCFTNPSVPLQLDRVRRFYQQLWSIYRAEKCQCLWDLGDTTDDRSAVPIPAIDAVLEGLSPFPKSDLNLKLIGNHEQYTRDTAKHIGRMFERLFRVVESTAVLEVSDSTVIVCHAYPASDAALNEALRIYAYKYRAYDQRILLGHFQVSGCRLAAGTALSGADPLLLRKYSLCLLGHIHRPQTIGNAHYVGSPFQQNFGEKGEAKRVGVLDVETLRLRWIPITGYPEYRVVSYADWCKQVRKEEEHRYQIILTSPEESKAFYAHPLMTRAEPIYNYQSDVKSTPSVQHVWTKDALMQRYVRLNPPGTLGLSETEEDLLAAGCAIAED